jgi:hypothetical protein
MGLFDEVLCNHDLFGEHKGERQRMKSMNPFSGAGAREQYEITPSGRLEFLEYVVEDHSDSTSEGLDLLSKKFTMVLTGKRRDMNYHGSLRLSASGRAKFIDGTLVAVESQPKERESESEAAGEYS